MLMIITIMMEMRMMMMFMMMMMMISMIVMMLEVTAMMIMMTMMMTFSPLVLSQPAGDHRPGRPAAGPGAQCHAEGVGADMAQTLRGRPWLPSNQLLCPFSPVLTAGSHTFRQKRDFSMSGCILDPTSRDWLVVCCQPEPRVFCSPPGQQHGHVPGPPADGVQPDGVPLTDRLRNTAQG